MIALPVTLLLICVAYYGGSKVVTVTTTTQEELSGEYYGSNGAGIRFQVAINSTYYTLIVTSNGTGMDIINVMHPQSSNMTLTSIINTATFMIMMNSTSQMNDYVVPGNATDLMETMMRSDDSHMTDDLFQELVIVSSEVNIIRQLYLRFLALSKEALLIIEAAKALVEMSSANLSYSPVRQFYLLGLQLEKLRDQATKHGSCPASGYCMCGSGNSCWSYLCGDCCPHHYCETHDHCCLKRGFFTWACFQVGYDYSWSNCSDQFSCFSMEADRIF